VDIAPSNKIITLNTALDPLKDQFNNNKENIRFLALLSPTCPLWRDQGARAVHETIITIFADADIAASIVWIPILGDDSIGAALPSVKYLSDKRFRHFYDQDQIVGKEIANSIGWGGHVAWDIYLFYARYAAWNNGPPAPKTWMHQLKDSWADKEHFRRGDSLVKELLNAMTKLLDIKNAWFLLPGSNTQWTIIASRFKWNIISTNRWKYHFLNNPDS